MNMTYHYEIPSGKYDAVCSEEFDIIEECVEDCKRACDELEIDYNRRDIKLFLTDRDGTEECTEEGEFAG